MTRLLAAAAGLLMGGTMAAQAALIDFTAPPFTGTGSVLNGITFTVAPNVGALSFNTGADEAPGPVGPLAGLGDGIGVVTGRSQAADEIDNGPPVEYVTVRFSRPITLRTIYALDLFIAETEDDSESFFVFEGEGLGGPLLGSFNATERINSLIPGTGFGTFEAGFRGSAFTFEAGLGNDRVGVGDFALAGLEVAPIPLPASVLLLGAALGGLGLARRRA